MDKGKSVVREKGRDRLETDKTKTERKVEAVTGLQRLADQRKKIGHK
ncbi:MAG: hypothetical protein ACE3JR_16235 [Ectobacillus sp.]